MSVTEFQQSPDRGNGHQDRRPIEDRVSGLRIVGVEAFRLKLPYKHAVAFHSVTEGVGQYVILRLTLADGTEGIAEAVCRPAMSGEDAASVAYQIEAFFTP